MLITHCCFSVAKQFLLKVKDFSVPHALLVRGCIKSCVKAWPRQLTQTAQRSIPWHRISSPAYKLRKLHIRGLIVGWCGSLLAGGQQFYCASLDSPVFCYSLPFSLSLLSLLLYFISIIKMFLWGLPFPFNSPPCYGGWRQEKWASSCNDI